MYLLLTRHHSIAPEDDQPSFSITFFFNDTATTEIYTLSLHDALPISCSVATTSSRATTRTRKPRRRHSRAAGFTRARSEEHTSELQSLAYLVCRLLLEKKKTTKNISDTDGVESLICVSRKSGVCRTLT